MSIQVSGTPLPVSVLIVLEMVTSPDAWVFCTNWLEDELLRCSG
jgi:hypothetical protein